MTQDFNTALAGFLTMAQGLIDDNCKQNGFVMNDELIAKHGPRYVKIIRRRKGNTLGSAHCFIVKENGNVLKAASWSAPAKGVRSNIYAADFGASGMGPYGTVYHN